MSTTRKVDHLTQATPIRLLHASTHANSSRRENAGSYRKIPRTGKSLGISTCVSIFRLVDNAVSSLSDFFDLIELVRYVHPRNYAFVFQIQFILIEVISPTASLPGESMKDSAID